ncbi:MAG: hypothetical protein GKR87_07595 [Kiritimatiellae bacterium]|nr:hypothetical protein [Kiritimatiellia bacterium]
MLQTVQAGQESSHTEVKEHLLHGVARRLNVLKRTIENIFEDFPLTTTQPVDHEVLYDVQINLHAFVMNLYGIYDNWAWAYIYQHNLFNKIDGKHEVSLFKQSTTKHLPKILKEYLVSKTMCEWHEQYLKSYRDALAHRIPLYIPPAE